MAQTGSASFPSVQHNITPERVVFVYNSTATGSRDVALAYQSARDIPDENIIDLAVPLPTPGTTGVTTETAISYSDYYNTIEKPLKDRLATIGSQFSSAGEEKGSIWVIILGYGIPLRFEDNDGEIIAVASAIQRLGNNSRKLPNFTYDRRGVFKFFDETDASELFITAVISGPTSAAALKLIERSIDVDTQTFIAGQIFVDPYGLKLTDDQLKYQDDIIDFIDNEAAYLGLTLNKTIDLEDPYKEPTISKFFRDSFYWGWYNPTFSKNLFFNQNERRVFLYNADDRAASNIHFYKNDSPFDENGSDLWCNLAINISPGYASCAGAVDDPGEDAFLRPRPFFESLHRGATLGEAFLFASKFVNWKTILIGDPLMVVNFPNDLPSHQDANNTLLPNKEVIFRIKESIEESLAWGARQTKLLNSLVNSVVGSTNLSEAIYLLEPIATWRDLKNQKSQNDIVSPAISGLLSYILKTTRLTLPEWLIKNGFSITSLLNDALSGIASATVSSTLEYPQGEWEHTFVYIHSILTLDDIFFQLQVSTNQNFTNIVIDVDSSTDITGWKYESEPYIFTQLSDSGFPSNFSGRRIKYISPEDKRLTRAEVYYVRWRAFNDENNQVFPVEEDYFVETNPIIVSR
jgi:uncharacterized protein (TIGR03790 family)